MFVVITNRALCKEDFLTRIEKIARGKPDRIVLREKQIGQEEYEQLAAACLEICKRYDVELWANTAIDAAKHVGIQKIQLPFSVFEEKRKMLHSFDRIGVSIHSKEEAVAARELGADELTAGHIYETSCKSGLAPRGLQFLKEISLAAKLPVNAVGGITPDRVDEILQAGASGICVMSSLMQCEDPERLTKIYQSKIKKALSKGKANL